jgi:hypothetical protein
MIQNIRSRNKRSRKQHRGGALYTFDLSDKIGGLPSRVPLNGTQDGDCPGTDTKDLGFVNYGVKSGGSRRHSKHKKSHRKSHHKNKSRKTKKSNRKH